MSLNRLSYRKRFLVGIGLYLKLNYANISPYYGDTGATYSYCICSKSKTAN